MIQLLIAALLAVAASLAAAAPATLEPSRFNDGAEVDAAEVGRRLPLVLVHGLGGTGQGWENFLQAYARQPAWRAAFKPYTFRYASTATEVLADPTAPRTVQGLGAALRDALQARYDQPAAAPHFGFGGRSLVILAHSMGGLVARSMMQEHSFADGSRGGERVLHLVTLGTPHQGTPLADVALNLGLRFSDETLHAYTGFLADLAWTNFDQRNFAGRLCNPWLARLNAYAPAGAGWYGNCGSQPANPLRGFYERIVAYGARTLQQPDLQLGLGVFKPGSAAALLASYAWLHDAPSLGYDNDGLVPYSSAQFDWRPIGARRQAYACDHRYIERGYPEVVRSATATYGDWAFCAASLAGVTPSGTSGGWAVPGTIVADIAATVVTASQAERVLDWAEQAYAPFLQPAGARTDLADGFHFRHYPQTHSYAGVKDGRVYYLGPVSAHRVVEVATLAQFLKAAEAAGF